MTQKTLALFALFGLLAIACALLAPPLPSGSPEDQLATFVAATLQAVHAQQTEQSGGDMAVPTPLPAILPHSVYYLSGPEGEAQVWRLGSDGLTQTRLTAQAGGVNSFAVSRADGSLAILSNNQLYLLDAGGGDPRLVADGSQAAENAPDYFYRGRVSNPSFSPDGRILAFAHNGLHLYDVASGDDWHLLVNQVDEPEEGLLLPEELYFPGEWAPDNRHLVVDIAYLEGDALAVVDWQANPPLTRMKAGGLLCCQVSWAPDSGSILVASPYLGLVSPGLWRYDANTGAEGVLVAGSEGDGTFEFVGWALQLSNGELVYFYASTAEVPEGDVPLLMVRSALDGRSNRVQLRSESFSIREALWAEDGSLALIRLSSSSAGSQVVLAQGDGSPLQVLLSEARGLAWGP